MNWIVWNIQRQIVLNAKYGSTESLDLHFQRPCILATIINNFFKDFTFDSFKRFSSTTSESPSSSSQNSSKLQWKDSSSGKAFDNIPRKPDVMPEELSIFNVAQETIQNRSNKIPNCLKWPKSLASEICDWSTM